jgi:DNA-binding transcriptional regulator YiaG
VIVSNVVNALKQEILRLAASEAKGQIAKARKAATEYRMEVAELKRLLRQREREIRLLKKRADQPQPAEEDPLVGIRYSSKSVRSQRQRLGLSVEEYAMLIGVAPLTLRNWESGKARPRKAQLATLVAVRGIGKRVAMAKLAELAQ